MDLRFNYYADIHLCVWFFISIVTLILHSANVLCVMIEFLLFSILAYLMCQ
jgi:hypothetical protein